LLKPKGEMTRKAVLVMGAWVRVIRSDAYWDTRGAFKYKELPT